MKKDVVFIVVLALAVAAVVVGPRAEAAESFLYKFTNESGDLVFSYTLPPEQAQAGYEKLDAQTGQVLETVAPALPPKELAAALRRDRALRACRDELVRIYALYGAERDIEYAQDQALEASQKRVSQVRGNLAQARRELERLQSQAAAAERSGKVVSASLVNKIGRSESQIQTLEQEIALREQEQDEARNRYQRELARFRDGTCPEPDTSVATTTDG